MAGIGFELRKYLESDSYLGVLKAYGYAGIIAAGPWILSILGVMLVGVLSIIMEVESHSVHGFLVSVTWLMATSLIGTGFLLLLFVRFVADRLYEKADDLILPNVIGLLFFSTLVTGTLATVVMLVFFPNQPLAYKALMIANYTVICNVWYAVIFASGIKQYRLIVSAFLLGYITVIVASLSLQRYGMEGLLAGLFIGHGVLLFFMLTIIFRQYKSQEFVRFDFLRRKNIKLLLIFIGFFYNAGIWADKLLFWVTPHVSQEIIGPLRASIIYDLPIFIAYLSIIPGMAIFLVKIETDFAEAYTNYFDAARKGKTLQEIEVFNKNMQESIREGLLQIAIVQAMTTIVIFLLSPHLLNWLNISPQFLHILFIDVVAVSLQVVLLSILNVLFYLDRLHSAFMLTFTLLVSNTLLTWITLQLDPVWYGFGFGASMLLCTLMGLFILYKAFLHLDYHTFMLQL
jgi:uncharacterized membrane protein